MRRAVLALPLLLLALVPSSGAQTLPPCGPEQHQASLDLPSEMYATHEYDGEVSFERPPTSSYSETHVRVTGPAGVVRRVSDGSRLDLVPQTGGTLSLTVSWDQEVPGDPPTCSASATFDFQVREALPVVLWPWKRGKPVEATSGPGYGFTLRFRFATQGRNKEAWDKGDLTPLRVEARAVKAARRPSPALTPAVIEFPAGEFKVRRSRVGVVEVRRARPQVDPHFVEVFVATRKAPVRRGLTVNVSQGARSLGSFTLVGRCNTRISYGNTTAFCNFPGRQTWLLNRGVEWPVRFIPKR